MPFNWAAILVVILFQSGLCLSHRPQLQDVTVSKKTALSFYKRSVDDKFLEECYGEESCDLEEVVENYDSTENAYERWNSYRCQRKHEGCKAMACRGNPIGMENGKIPDYNMDASSFFRPSRLSLDKYGPEAGRLNNKNGVWCAGEEHKRLFLQIKLPTMYRVCAVATQGSPMDDDAWVKKYRIEFSPHGKHYRHYKEKGELKVFAGNTNADDMVKHDLGHPVTAQFIRFVPLEWSSHKPCMRVEVYGTGKGGKQ